MGFTPKPKVYALRWPEGSYWHGFEVDMRSISISELRHLTELADAASSAPADSTDEGMAVLDDLHQLIVDKLVSWNLEIPEGHPVDPTVENLAAQDLELTMTIVMGWVEALVEVDDPLAQGSNDGGPSVELSIPMASLSEPPAS